jgi:hypothetical protein
MDQTVFRQGISSPTSPHSPTIRPHIESTTQSTCRLHKELHKELHQPKNKAGLWYAYSQALTTYISLTIISNAHFIDRTTSDPPSTQFSSSSRSRVYSVIDPHLFPSARPNTKPQSSSPATVLTKPASAQLLGTSLKNAITGKMSMNITIFPRRSLPSGPKAR